MSNTPEYTKNEILEVIDGTTTIDISGESVLHVVVGNDEYMPSTEDLQKYADLFQNALGEKIKAVVATPYNASVIISSVIKT